MELASCGFCQIDSSGAFFSQLLCSHKVHTECLLKKMAMDAPAYYNCSVCGQQLYQDTQAGVSVFTGEDSSANIVELYNQNEEFRKDVKKMYKDLQSLNKAYRVFQKVSWAEKKDFKLSVEPLRESIQELQKQKVRGLRASPEFKSYNKEYRSIQKTVKKLLEKYKDQGLNEHDFRHLESVSGLRRIRKLLRNTHQRFFRYFFRFRVYI